MKHSRLYFTFAITILVACQQPPTEPPTPTPLPAPVRPTFLVQRGDVVQEIAFDGRIESAVTQELAFSIDGQVRNVYVQQDEAVTVGQLLADLTAVDELEAQLATARLEAETRQRAAANALRRAEIAVEIARLNLKLARARGAPPDEIAILELQAELVQMDLDEVQAKITLESAAGEVAKLEERWAACRLMATMDGQLLATVRPGRTVRAGVPVMTIGDPNQLELVAKVGNEQLQMLSEGMTVTVTFKDRPDRSFVGRLRQLPYPYGSGGAQGVDDAVRISLYRSPKEAGYKIGDVARISVVLAHKQDVLWLPPAAIRSIAGRTFVVVPGEGGQLRTVDVKVGIRSAERVEITEGLSAGQTVIKP